MDGERAEQVEEEDTSTFPLDHWLFVSENSTSKYWVDEESREVWVELKDWRPGFKRPKWRKKLIAPSGEVMGTVPKCGNNCRIEKVICFAKGEEYKPEYVLPPSRTSWGIRLVGKDGKTIMEWKKTKDCADYYKVSCETIYGRVRRGSGMDESNQDEHLEYINPDRKPVEKYKRIEVQEEQKAETKAKREGTKIHYERLQDGDW